MIQERTYTHDEVEYFNRQHQEEMNAGLAQCKMQAAAIAELLEALIEAVEANERRPAPYRTVMPRAYSVLAKYNQQAA